MVMTGGHSVISGRWPNIEKAVDIINVKSGILFSLMHAQLFICESHTKTQSIMLLYLEKKSHIKFRLPIQS